MTTFMFIIVVKNIYLLYKNKDFDNQNKRKRQIVGVIFSILILICEWLHKLNNITDQLYYIMCITILIIAIIIVLCLKK